ncbi:MAG: FAD-dependent oxidoreductase [Cyanobacteriota bacterium]|nr:FAD-dependent oxidoreductase [Cyanobacteriota bacterium]
MVISKDKAKSQFPQWAAIDPSRGSISEYIKKCRKKVIVPPGQENFGQGKTAVIIGAGVAGLTSAYELLNNEDINLSRCVILEANDRIGGRSYTVRPGDVIKEDNSDAQVCQFDSEAGEPYPPYLNAGPGRIPSSHKLLLGYMKKFNVPMEVYVMASDSNRTYVDGHFENPSVPNRQLAYNMQGSVAECLYKLLSTESCSDMSLGDIEKFKEFLIRFGDLDENGEYKGSDRAGYKCLPGVEAGIPADPLSLQDLVQSEFWRKANFYQPIDFLWQPTLFQPVGGMDKIVYAFKEQLELDKRSKLQLNAVVSNIKYNDATNKYCITYNQDGQEKQIEADYCLSNIPIPLLENITSEINFTEGFKTALQAVYKAQNEGVKEKNGYCRKFLADTTKVGWQAERHLWQEAEGASDVPIYGGISWSSDEIAQIWYPSDEYHAELGVLTGAYNFSAVAKEWGNKKPEERLELAKNGARNLGGDEFANGLKHGLAIAWQNIPHQKGGWAQWNTVGEEKEKYFNILTKGNIEVDGNNTFYILGDQLSHLSGWQEGAVASAINAVSELCDPSYTVPDIDLLPDTRLTVEGAFWATLPAYVS